MADLTLGITAEDKASDVFKKVGKAILQFGADGVKMAMEQEKADAQLSSALKQLGYDSKALTETFKNQAAQFQRNLGVSDDLVQGMQSLMIRFGTAPKDIQGATQAILDYSAATGIDAESATTSLMRAIENGGKGLGKMGIAIDATGDKTKDLAQVVAALTWKFGGSAAAQADTLAGQTRIVTAQVGEMQEAFGSLSIKVAHSTGIFRKLQEALGAVDFMIFGDDAMDAFTDRANRIQVQAAVVDAAIREHKELVEELNEAFDLQAPQARVDAILDTTTKQLAQIEKEKGILAKLKGESAKAGNIDAGITTEGKSAKAMAANMGIAAKEDVKKAAAEAAKELAKAKAKAEELVERDIADFREDSARRAEIQDQEIRSRSEAFDAMLFDEQTAAEQRRVATLAAAEQLKVEGEAAMQAAGIAVGTAFVGSLGAEFKKLQGGGEFDLGAVIKSMIPIIVTLALAGTPAAPFAPIIGGAISAGLNAFHDGGYVDGIPRYHSGGMSGDEEAAILQRGEYVVNRADVGANGGPRGVERAVKGGGGGTTVLNISAFDTQSFQEYLGGRGGSGAVRAVNQGRGELAQLIHRLKKR